MNLMKIQHLKFSYTFKETVMGSSVPVLANANYLLRYFSPFILQKSVFGITQTEKSAWFGFDHLLRFYEANSGKLVHFSF